MKTKDEFEIDPTCPRGARYFFSFFISNLMLVIKTEGQHARKS